MDKNKFNGIMARAQQLMLDENFNRAVDSKASVYSNSHSGGNVGGGDISMLESQVFGGGSTERKVVTPQQSVNAKGLNALPECMRESFAKTPPIQGDISDIMPTSGLEEALSLKNVKRPTMNENIIPSSNNSGIDYSLIKTIIDESVSRHMKQINESASPNFIGMRLVNGNKFQFVDGKGNIFEGVLKLKKRAEK